MVDELLVELHLLSHQRGFQADPLFAVGVVQVFQAFAKGYRPEEHREPLFEALCKATGFDPAELRGLSDTALSAMGDQQVETVKGWISIGGNGAPEPLSHALHQIRRSDFHYSRLMAVGLLTLLEKAQGAKDLDAPTLRSYAHDLGEAMGLMKDRLDKDLSLYAGNLEKMSQAVELMEETLAAERRRRERQVQDEAAVSAAAEVSPSGS
jgi:photosystem II biogenesis protein Psp29